MAALLVATLVVTGLTACSSGGSAATSDTTTPPRSSVTSPAPPVYTDPSKPIRVAIGREFVIALRADPQSGLSWQPAAPPDPAVLLSIGSAFRNAPHSRNVEQVMLFGGRGYGTTKVRLYYRSPKRGATVLRAATFTVTVFDPHAPSTTTTSSTSTTVAGQGVGLAGSTTTTVTAFTTTTLATTTTTAAAPSTTPTTAGTTTTTKK